MREAQVTEQSFMSLKDRSAPLNLSLGDQQKLGRQDLSKESLITLMVACEQDWKAGYD